MVTPMTIDAVLALHAQAPDPAKAALESILNERNTFASQNSQLWNLMRKQRSHYAHMTKDVERLRSERDALKQRLKEYERAGRDQPERRLRPSHSSSQMNASASNDPHNHDRVEQQSSRPHPDPRAGVARHKSDESHCKFCLHVLFSHQTAISHMIFTVYIFS